MINNVELNFRVDKNVIPETELIDIVQNLQNKFIGLAREINQQNGIITIDVYGSRNYRYDIEGVDSALRYKLLNDFIHR
jgi:hypothetical protein